MKINYSNWIKNNNKRVHGRFYQMLIVESLMACMIVESLRHDYDLKCCLSLWRERLLLADSSLKRLAEVGQQRSSTIYESRADSVDGPNSSGFGMACCHQSALESLGSYLRAVELPRGVGPLQASPLDVTQRSQLITRTFSQPCLGAAAGSIKWPSVLRTKPETDFNPCGMTTRQRSTI